MNFMINPKFESCIPELTEEEYRQLEENILSQGEVIEPILLWNGFVVDGHHRLRIVQEHPELRYHTKELAFEDDASVVNWICKNQLGRRNLTSEQRRFLIGSYYGSEKNGRGGKRSCGHDACGRFTAKLQMDTLRSDEKATEDVAKRIAREQHVSRASVLRAEVFSKAVDLADNILPGTKAQILHGDVKLQQSDAELILKAPPEERSDILNALLPGRELEERREPEKDHPKGNKAHASIQWSYDDDPVFAKNYAAHYQMDLSHLQEACYLRQAVDLGEELVSGFREKFFTGEVNIRKADAMRIVQASPEERKAIVEALIIHPPKEVSLDVESLFDDLRHLASAISEKELKSRWLSMLKELTAQFPDAENADRSKVLAKLAIHFFTRYLNSLNTHKSQ